LQAYGIALAFFGHAAAALFGADAKTEQDLNRMKAKSGTPAYDAAAKDQSLYTH
jgi:hypothetical protein